MNTEQPTEKHGDNKILEIISALILNVAFRTDSWTTTIMFSLEEEQDTQTRI